MSENNSGLLVSQMQTAKALAAEAGISERQALELVQLLGFNRASLLFHARALKKREGL